MLGRRTDRRVIGEHQSPWPALSGAHRAPDYRLRIRAQSKRSSLKQISQPAIATTPSPFKFIINHEFK
jgi:hypothetical protein